MENNDSSSFGDVPLSSAEDSYASEDLKDTSPFTGNHLMDMSEERNRDKNDVVTTRRSTRSESIEEEPDPFTFELLPREVQLRTLTAYLKEHFPSKTANMLQETVNALVQGHGENLGGLLQSLESRHGGKVMAFVPPTDDGSGALQVSHSSRHLLSGSKVDSLMLKFTFNTSRPMGIEFTGGDDFEDDLNGAKLERLDSASSRFQYSPVVVVKSRPGTQARIMGVAAGDVLIAINDHNIGRCSLEELAPLLSNRDTAQRTLTFCRSLSSFWEYRGKSWELLNITFTKRMLSLILEGGEPLLDDRHLCSDIKVQSILASGAGMQAGVQVGDMILAVNGNIVKGMSMDSFKDCMADATKSDGHVHFSILFGRPVNGESSRKSSLEDALVRYSVTFRRDVLRECQQFSIENSMSEDTESEVCGPAKQQHARLVGFDLGMGVPINPEVHDQHTVYVRCVTKNSVASRQDIRRGDVLVMVDGEPVDDYTLDQVQKKVESALQKLVVENCSDDSQLEMVFERSPTDQEGIIPLWESDQFDVGFAASPNLGLSFACRNAFADEVQRFVVTDIDDNSAAMACGIILGDCLVAVNGDRVDHLSVKEIYQLLESQKSQYYLTIEREFQLFQKQIPARLRSVCYGPGIELGFKFQGGTEKENSKNWGFHAIQILSCKKPSRSYSYGVRKNDILIAINEDLVFGRSLNATYQTLARTAGRTCRLLFLRGRRNAPISKVVNLGSADKVGIKFEKLKCKDNLVEDSEGYCVSAFRDEPIPKRCGVRLGDLLIGVNNISTTVERIDQLHQVLSRTSGKSRKLTFFRLDCSYLNKKNADGNILNDNDSDESSLSGSESFAGGFSDSEQMSDDHSGNTTEASSVAPLTEKQKISAFLRVVHSVTLQHHEDTQVVFSTTTPIRNTDVSSDGNKPRSTYLMPCVGVQQYFPAVDKIEPGERVLSVDTKCMLGRGLDTTQTTFDGLLSTSKNIQIVLLRSTDTERNKDVKSDGGRLQMFQHSPDTAKTHTGYSVWSCTFSATAKIGLKFGGGEKIKDSLNGVDSHIPVYVQGVESNAAGYKMGIKLHDMLLSINDKSMYGCTVNNAQMELAKNTGKVRLLVFLRMGSDGNNAAPDGSQGHVMAPSSAEQALNSNHEGNQRSKLGHATATAASDKILSQMNSQPIAGLKTGPSLTPQPKSETGFNQSKPLENVSDANTPSFYAVKDAKSRLKTGPALTPETLTNAQISAASERRREFLKVMTPIKLRRLASKHGLARNLDRKTLIEKIVALEKPSEEVEQNTDQQKPDEIPESNGTSPTLANDSFTTDDEDEQWALEQRLRQLKEEHLRKASMWQHQSDNAAANGHERFHSSVYDDEYVATHGPSGPEDVQAWAYHSGNLLKSDLSPSLWREKVYFLESQRRMQHDFARARLSSVSDRQVNLELLERVSQKLSKQAARASRLKIEKVEQEEEHAQKMALLKQDFERREAIKEQEMYNKLQQKVKAMENKLKAEQRKNEALKARNHHQQHHVDKQIGATGSLGHVNMKKMETDSSDEDVESQRGTEKIRRSPTRSQENTLDLDFENPPSSDDEHEDEENGSDCSDMSQKNASSEHNVEDITKQATRVELPVSPFPDIYSNSNTSSDKSDSQICSENESNDRLSDDDSVAQSSRLHMSKDSYPASLSNNNLRQNVIQTEISVAGTKSEQIENGSDAFRENEYPDSSSEFFNDSNESVDVPASECKDNELKLRSGPAAAGEIELEKDITREFHEGLDTGPEPEPEIQLSEGSSNIEVYAGENDTDGDVRISTNDENSTAKSLDDKVQLKSAATIKDKEELVPSIERKSLARTKTDSGMSSTPAAPSNSICQDNSEFQLEHSAQPQPTGAQSGLAIEVAADSKKIDDHSDSRNTVGDGKKSDDLSTVVSDLVADLERVSETSISKLIGKSHDMNEDRTADQEPSVPHEEDFFRQVLFDVQRGAVGTNSPPDPVEIDSHISFVEDRGSSAHEKQLPPNESLQKMTSKEPVTTATSGSFDALADLSEQNNDYLEEILRRNEEHAKNLAKMVMHHAETVRTTHHVDDAKLIQRHRRYLNHVQNNQDPQVRTGESQDSDFHRDGVASKNVDSSRYGQGRRRIQQRHISSNIRNVQHKTYDDDRHRSSKKSILEYSGTSPGVGHWDHQQVTHSHLSSKKGFEWNAARSTKAHKSITSPTQKELVRRSVRLEKNFQSLLKSDAIAQSKLDDMCAQMKLIITNVEKAVARSNDVNGSLNVAHPATDEKQRAEPSKDAEELDLSPLWRKSYPHIGSISRSWRGARAIATRLYKKVGTHERIMAAEKRRKLEERALQEHKIQQQRHKAHEHEEFIDMVDQIGGKSWEGRAASLAKTLNEQSQSHRSQVAVSSKAAHLNEVADSIRYKDKIYTSTFRKSVAFKSQTAKKSAGNSSLTTASGSKFKHQNEDSINSPLSKSNRPLERAEFSHAISQLVDRLNKDPLLSTPIPSPSTADRPNSLSKPGSKEESKDRHQRQLASNPNRAETHELLQEPFGGTNRISSTQSSPPADHVAFSPSTPFVDDAKTRSYKPKKALSTVRKHFRSSINTREHFSTDKNDLLSLSNARTIFDPPDDLQFALKDDFGKTQQHSPYAEHGRVLVQEKTSQIEHSDKSDHIYDRDEELSPVKSARTAGKSHSFRELLRHEPLPGADFESVRDENTGTNRHVGKGGARKIPAIAKFQALLHRVKSQRSSETEVMLKAPNDVREMVTGDDVESSDGLLSESIEGSFQSANHVVAETWSMHIDEKYGAKYWYNEETGVSTWKDPTSVEQNLSIHQDGVRNEDMAEIKQDQDSTNSRQSESRTKSKDLTDTERSPRLSSSRHLGEVSRSSLMSAFQHRGYIGSSQVSPSYAGNVGRGPIRTPSPSSYSSTPSYSLLRSHTRTSGRRTPSSSHR